MKKIIKMSKPKQTSPYGNEKGDDELIEFTKEEKMKCKLCGAEIITPTKTIKIKELKIEVETQIHDKGNKLSDIKIPKGWRLLKAQEVITLHNKYAKELNMLVTWEFIEQPFELNKQKSYVARFVAVSDGAYLYCGRGPEFSGSSLGVRFCKDITEGNR